MNASRRRVTVLGHRLEVDRAEGPQPTLVFLHEGLGSVSAWRGFSEAVATSARRASMVYSRRGYGASEGRPGPWPTSFMHEEARTFLPALLEHEDVQDAILVGHSDGASIALLAASLGLPSVRGVVAIAPHVMVEDVTVASIASLRDAYLDPATKLRPRLARSILGANAGASNVDALFEAWTGVWLSSAFRAWDIREELARVPVPVLVIQGEDDAYGTLAQVEEVCRRVERADRVVIPKAGHAPFRDAPDVVRDAIVAFVDRVASREPHEPRERGETSALNPSRR